MQLYINGIVKEGRKVYLDIDMAWTDYYKLIRWYQNSHSHKTEITLIENSKQEKIKRNDRTT
jgi:hypothetical protein